MISTIKLNHFLNISFRFRDKPIRISTTEFDLVRKPYEKWMKFLYYCLLYDPWLNIMTSSFRLFSLENKGEPSYFPIFGNRYKTLVKKLVLGL